MLNVLVCAVVFTCMSVCVHSHECSQMTVHYSDCRTFISGPSADPAYLPQQQSRTLPLYILLSLTFSCSFVVLSPHITVTPFFFFLPQTPRLSLVSLIRQYYQQHLRPHHPCHLPSHPLLTFLTPHPHPSHVSYFLYFVLLAC